MLMFGDSLQKAKNLTPHDVVVFDQGGTKELLRIPKSGHVARVSSKQPRVWYADAGTDADGETVRVPIRVGAPVYEDVDLDGYDKGSGPINVIVSAIAANKLSESEIATGGWVWSPDTDPSAAVRDPATGVIVGVTRMVLWTPPVCTVTQP